MRVSKNSNQKDQKEINLKFKKIVFPDINKDKRIKKNINEKSKKSIKVKEEKEKIEKEKKKIYENGASINQKNAQSKNSFKNNIFKFEKFLVNKDKKLQKTYTKKYCSETELERLQKKKKSI